MRILTVGGKMLCGSLRDLGHQVLGVGPAGSAAHPDDREADFYADPPNAQSLVRSFTDAFRPDWVLQVDDSTPLVHLGLEESGIPRAWYAIDSHLHAPWHRHYAPAFDLVFVAQKNRVAALSAFRGPGREAVWMPLFFNGEPAFTPWADRPHDVAFVGNVSAALNPARVALLEGLRAAGITVRTDMDSPRLAYRGARVVINQAAADDLNFRFFEASGHGALLVTDRLSHSLEDMGKPGEDFLVYEPGNVAEAAERIRWALANPADAEAMARRAQAGIIASHTQAHRVAAIARAMESAGIAKGGVPAGARGHVAAACGFLAMLDLPGGLPGFFASETRRRASVPAGHPWAVLAAAFLDLNGPDPAATLALLAGAAPPDGGEGEVSEFRRRLAYVKGILLARVGRNMEARQVVLVGLRAFPGDADLMRLGAALEMG